MVFQDEGIVKGVEEENYFFRVTEAIFVGWFTLEYIIRFIVSPRKVRLLKFEPTSSYLEISDWISHLVSQYYRPPWNTSILCLRIPQSLVFPILPWIHCQGCSNIPNSSHLENFQAIKTHHRFEDSGNNTEEQSQVCSPSTKQPCVHNFINPIIWKNQGAT